jgi:hypothetical protein
MCELKTLEGITFLHFLSVDLYGYIDYLSPISVLSFGPVISSGELTYHKILRLKKLAIGTSLYIGR